MFVCDMEKVKRKADFCHMNGFSFISLVASLYVLALYLGEGERVLCKQGDEYEES